MAMGMVEAIYKLKIWGFLVDKITRGKKLRE